MWTERQEYDSESGFRGRLLRRLGSLDYLQIFAMFSLLGVGLIFIRSIALQHGTLSAMSFFYKQLIWIAAGSCGWLLTSSLDYRRVEFKVLGVLFYLASVALLVVVLFFGVRVYDAVRWLDIRPLGLRLQPSELSKLGLTLLLSAMFSTRLFKIDSFFCLGLGVAAVAVPFGLTVIEPDLGSALILLPIFLGIVFCAGLKWRYIFLAISAAVLFGGAALINETMRIHPLLKEYQRARIQVFLNPERDLTGRGYNQYQAKLAVGSGGLLGKGIGEGTQNQLGFLPATISNNDFIFSVIAEEVGFLGCLGLLGLYLLLFYSILRSAFLCQDCYGRYLGVGICAIIFTHMFINIGMSLGVTPVTGLSLPFVSYGGSFIMTGMTSLGIMQSVYQYGRDED